MSDLPQLQQALVTAAARRNRRSDRTAGVVVVAVVALIVAGVVLTTRDGRHRTEVPATRVVATPQAPTVVNDNPLTGISDAVRNFAALQSTTNLADPPRNLRRQIKGPGPTRAQTHLIRDEAHLRVWVAVANGEICTYVEHGMPGTGSGGCQSQSLAGFAAGHQSPGEGYEVGRYYSDTLVPDGTTDAEVTWSDGTRDAVPIVNNFLSVSATDKRPHVITWTAPDGTMQRFGLGGAPPDLIPRTAPVMALPDLHGGGRTSLADFRGRPVLVVFGASWCSPCVASLPALRAAHLPTLFVDVRDRGQDLRAIGTLPHVVTDTGRYADRWRVTAYPVAALVGPDGRVVAHKNGPFGARWLRHAQAKLP